jgi:2'-5' RNA ligase
VVEQQKSKRLFLALWPDDTVRQQLADVQRTLGHEERLKSAKTVPFANLHITTHFLGAVSDDVHRQLRTLLPEVSAHACTLTIDRWGYFPRAKVIWLGADAPEALIDLVVQTGSCIKACIEGYDHKRFVPHVTIFRKARRPAEVDAFDPIEWHIDRFALVESVTHPQGAEYTVLQEWMLPAG